ncbi:DUF3455 domain-containing protein [Methylacidiphilum caldifontis]|uniref:DUF3455 domain-containing protein n=1 Tax=Methylacidiphilum caldifontis TaxID=2795386 RepID=A0A4Y8PEW4_9BACT|nr:DUF3455 domain-containing protein [Methylacidiphilum caldifontis]TFE70589.1 hypothetical protein A7Q10_05795 [Methylacidiphilum caldifontis]
MKIFLYGLMASLFLSPLSLLAAQKNPGLTIPSHSLLLWVAQAEGVQIYVSKPKKGEKNSFEWTFKSPKATLLSKSGKKIGSHYSGPTWQANDGSKITASTPPESKWEQKNSIPWLLLKVKSHEGEGILSRVNYVLRIDTLGGLPPKNPPQKADQTVSIPYKATYLFLTPASK